MLYRLFLYCLLASAVLTGCVSAPPALVSPPSSLWRDDAFSPVEGLIGAEQVLAVSAPMGQYLMHELSPLLKRQGPVQALVTALTQPEWLQLRYDASMTRTAAQAFESRSGNCLSLVILTAALARELGLQVHFQEVLTDELWSRQAGMYVSSGHVNVTLGRPMSGPRGYDSSGSLTIDFLPPAQAQTLPAKPLTERTVLAMFMNNRAAEAIAQEDLDQAYAWARAAIKQDPGFLSAYNTLAVVYLRHADALAAELSLRYLLGLMPTHSQAMSNLVLALRAQGRMAEAEATANDLRRREKVAPFEFFNLGLAALAAGDALTARDWFRKELARDPDYHEFHFALARAELKLGHAQAAQRELELAVANSPAPATMNLYAAKLAHLRQLRSGSSVDGIGPTSAQ
jgi:Tfp pilus assembly protein PilF